MLLKLKGTEIAENAWIAGICEYWARPTCVNKVKKRCGLLCGLRVIESNSREFQKVKHSLSFVLCDFVVIK
jgi:hypothetical protein